MAWGMKGDPASGRIIDEGLAGEATASLCTCQDGARGSPSSFANSLYGSPPGSSSPRPFSLFIRKKIRHEQHDSSSMMSKMVMIKGSLEVPSSSPTRLGADEPPPTKGGVVGKWSNTCPWQCTP